MSGRLKFYGWGVENTGLDDDERDRLFRFLFDRLGVELRSIAAPRLDRVVEIDQASRAARIQAGIRGPAIEAALKPHGLSIRHYPQSFEFSTLGG